MHNADAVVVLLVLVGGGAELLELSVNVGLAVVGLGQVVDGGCAVRCQRLGLLPGPEDFFAWGGGVLVLFLQFGDDALLFEEGLHHVFVSGHCDVVDGTL